MPYDVQLKEVPKFYAASIEKRVKIYDLVPFIQSSMQKIEDTVKSKSGQIKGAPMCIYHGPVNENSTGPVEVCIPMADFLLLNNKEIRVKTFHKTNVAYTVITKRQAEFPAILQAYDAVSHWMKAHDHQMAASPREIYLADLETIEPNDSFIEIAWPVG